MVIAATPSGLDDLNRPYLLMNGGRLGALSVPQMEQALRRMGLRPEPVGNSLPPGFATDSPCWWLHMGGSRVLAGLADAATMAACGVGAEDIMVLPPVDRTALGGRMLMLRPDLDRTVAGECPAAVLPYQAAVLRDLFQLVVLLMDLFEAQHVFWSPARLWSHGGMLRDAVQEMLISAMPPVLHLVAFHKGVTGQWCSRGLALFAGQELCADPPASMPAAAVVQRLARLGLDMIVHGPVTAARPVPGLAPGEQLVLEPQRPTHGPPLVQVRWRDGE